jgi:hypothetical protein
VGTRRCAHSTAIAVKELSSRKADYRFLISARNASGDGDSMAFLLVGMRSNSPAVTRNEGFGIGNLISQPAELGQTEVMYSKIEYNKNRKKHNTLLIT